MKSLKNITQLLYIAGITYVALSVASIVLQRPWGFEVLLPVVSIFMLVLTPLNYTWIRELSKKPTIANKVLIGVHLLGIGVVVVVSLVIFGFIKAEIGY